MFAIKADEFNPNYLRALKFQIQIQIQRLFIWAQSG